MLSNWWNFFLKKGQRPHIIIFPQGLDELLCLCCAESRPAFGYHLEQGDWRRIFALPGLEAWDAEYSLLFVLGMDRWNLYGITCKCQLHCQHVETEWFPVKLTWSTRQKPSQRHQSFLCTSNCLSMPQWLCRVHYRSAWSLQTCLNSLFSGSCLHGKARFQRQGLKICSTMKKVLQKLSTLLTKREKYQSITCSNKLTGTH